MTNEALGYIRLDHSISLLSSKICFALGRKQIILSKKIVESPRRVAHSWDFVKHASCSQSLS